MRRLIRVKVANQSKKWKGTVRWGQINSFDVKSD